MDAVSQIALIAFPFVLGVLGYLISRMMDKNDQKLDKLDSEIHSLSDEISDLDKKIDVMSSKVSLTGNKIEEVKIQLRDVSKTLQGQDTRVDNIVSEQRIIIKDMQTTKENYGKVIQILEKIILKSKNSQQN
jgi:septal ring factor EnvC (AmiA/AmiB activator)